MTGHWRDILEARRRECKEEEWLRMDVAMDRALVLRSTEALVRAHVRHLSSGIKEEKLLVTPE
jgi:hypothetical protein